MITFQVDGAVLTLSTREGDETLQVTIERGSWAVGLELKRSDVGQLIRHLADFLTGWTL